MQTHYPDFNKSKAATCLTNLTSTIRKDLGLATKRQKKDCEIVIISGDQTDDQTSIEEPPNKRMRDNELNKIQTLKDTCVANYSINFEENEDVPFFVQSLINLN